MSVIASASEEEFIKLWLTPLRSRTLVYSLRRGLCVVFRRDLAGQRKNELLRKVLKKELKREHPG